MNAFFRIVVSILCLTLVGGTVAARTLVCESNDRSNHYCPTDTHGGVHLAVQYSKASCRQGSTWGYDNRGIWVSNGCRAQFDIGDYRSDHRSDKDSAAAAALAIGLIGAAAIAAKHDEDHRGNRDYDYRYDNDGGNYGGNYGPSDHITCESRDNRRQYCPANLRHARVDIERQLSDTRCRFAQNWGWDARGVWVSDGCRAVFSIY